MISETIATSPQAEKSSPRSHQHSPRCPCGQGLGSKFSLHWKGKISCCRECHLLTSTLLPTEGDLETQYRDEYFSQFQDERIGARANVFTHALEELGHRQQEKGTLIDVGCGVGTLLGLAEQQGWKGIGFDPSIESVNAAHGVGLEAYTQQWPPCPLSDNTVDAVTFINVLDLLGDPFAAVKEAWRVLRPNGLMYIRVPNGPVHLTLHGILPQVLFRQMNGLHLFGFGKKSFRYHLPRLGFSIQTIQTAPPSQGLPRGQHGPWKNHLKWLLKTLDTKTYQIFTALGLAHKAWGLSIEVIARKTAHPHD